MPDPFDPYRPPAASLEVPPGHGLPPTAGVSSSVVALLVETRTWVKLLAILYFVVFGLGVVAVVAVVALSVLSKGLIQILPLVLILVLYLVPTIFLWRYTTAVTALQNGGGQAALEDALRNQKSFWKYVGILALVMIGLYIAMFAIGGMSGLFTRGH
jgi:hypothetical protein